MEPRQVDQAIFKLQSLPTRDQAICVMMAAKRCEAIAAKWFERQKLGTAYRDYVTKFDLWAAAKASDDALEKSAQPLNRRLNRDPEREDDRLGAMAAHSLLDVMAVALGYSPEMLEEILTTAVYFAAAAYSGSNDVPLQVDADRLSPGELEFIGEWWQECVAGYPELAA